MSSGCTRVLAAIFSHGTAGVVPGLVEAISKDWTLYSCGAAIDAMDRYDVGGFGSLACPAPDNMINRAFVLCCVYYEPELESSMQGINMPVEY